MARRSSNRNQPNVGAWLGGNRGYLQSGTNTDTTAKIDAGGGQMEQVRAELGLGAYAAGIGATAAIGAGIAAARTVSSAYKKAKSTATPSRVVLYHGGATDLKGGVIDPSFVRGNAVSGQIGGNTAALNSQQLENVPTHLSQLRQNIKFSEDQLKIPGSYAAQNSAETLKKIDKLRRSAADLENWTNRAKQQNYFTAVGSPNETYTHAGSIHVISPRRADVQTGFGPSGEYQIVGRQKPVASFPTGGRSGPQEIEAIRLAQAKGAALQKKLQRQAAIKQTAKNLIPKRK